MYYTFLVICRATHVIKYSKSNCQTCGELKILLSLTLLLAALHEERELIEEKTQQEHVLFQHFQSISFQYTIFSAKKNKNMTSVVGPI